jgi:hypothetical protein
MPDAGRLKKLWEQKAKCQLCLPTLTFGILKESFLRSPFTDAWYLSAK